jgi:hypothetical protein
MKAHHHATFREKIKANLRTACTDPVGVEAFLKWVAAPSSIPT